MGEAGIRYGGRCDKVVGEIRWGKGKGKKGKRGR